GLVPRTRMARFTAYLAGIQVLLLGLEWVFQFTGPARIAGPLHGWTRFLGYVLAALLIFLALRWFRNHVMWSVRNRLIVTYLFIGGVPVTLAIALALGTSLVAFRHLAHFLALSEIGAQGQRLAAANAATAEQIEGGRTTPQQVMVTDKV